MADEKIWSIRGMPGAARRAALSKAASLGVSVGEYLAGLIAADNSGFGGQPEGASPSESEGVLADVLRRLGEVEQAIQGRGVSGVVQPGQEPLFLKVQAELAAHPEVKGWQRRAEHLIAVGLVRPGSSWSGESLRSWYGRQSLLG